MKKLLIATLFVSLFDLGAALAQTRAPSAPTAAQPSNVTVTYAKRTEMIFGEGDDVEGAVAQPMGDMVNGKKMLRQSSLVQPRLNFMPEILKSAESL